MPALLWTAKYLWLPSRLGALNATAHTAAGDAEGSVRAPCCSAVLGAGGACLFLALPLLSFFPQSSILTRDFFFFFFFNYF